MHVTRRDFTKAAAACVVAVPSTRLLAADGASAATGSRRGNPIAVSTYSFWRFKDDSKLSMEQCIDQASAMGFDAVELLQMQMESEDHGYLQKLKQRALINGISLCGLSTHQGFVSPDADIRQNNIDHTIRSIELAYVLGIPTMRVNTGRWGTSKDFDDLMANRGIEPRLPGYTDDDAFDWVIDSFEKCLPAAEKCGVTLGLENHWGLGRTPEGVLRIVDAVDSPWLQCTLDTGNFLEDPYDRLALDGAEDRVCPGQDVLRRWYLVRGRSRLPADCQDAAGARIPRLRLARIRGTRSLSNGYPEEPRATKNGV